MVINKFGDRLYKGLVDTITGHLQVLPENEHIISMPTCAVGITLYLLLQVPNHLQMQHDFTPKNNPVPPAGHRKRDRGGAGRDFPAGAQGAVGQPQQVHADDPRHPDGELPLPPGSIPAAMELPTWLPGSCWGHGGVKMRLAGPTAAAILPPVKTSRRHNRFGGSKQLIPGACRGHVVKIAASCSHPQSTVTALCPRRLTD